MTIGSISGIQASAGANLPAIDDIAFAVMALRLQTLDVQVAESIKAQQTRIELGNAIRARKTELESQLSESGATDPHDRVEVTDRTKYDYSIDENGEVVATPNGGLPISDTNDDGQYSVRQDRVDTDGDGTMDGWATRKQYVDAEIERLQGQLDNLNGDSEIAMMELNRLVNQRQTALQMTTNVLSSMHQSQMGIINNIGK